MSGGLLADDFPVMSSGTVSRVGQMQRSRNKTARASETPARLRETILRASAETS